MLLNSFVLRDVSLTWIVDRVEWLSIYNYIKSRLHGLSFDRDQHATDLLSDQLRKRSKVIRFRDLSYLFKKFNEAYVIGCSENVYSEVDSYIKQLENSFVIAADGATSVLLDYGIIPSIIVSDLDGNISDLLYASREGSVVVIHAHGDNIDMLREYTPMFQSYVIGSTQVEPRPFVYNFGGFTDGDRAVCLAYHIGVAKVNLLGFDFTNPSSCPGDERVLDEERSRVKLEIALMIMRLLIEKGLVINCVNQRSCGQVLHGESI